MSLRVPCTMTSIDCEPRANEAFSVASSLARWAASAGVPANSADAATKARVERVRDPRTAIERSITELWLMPAGGLMPASREPDILGAIEESGRQSDAHRRGTLGAT